MDKICEDEAVMIQHLHESVSLKHKEPLKRRGVHPNGGPVNMK
jgi:hypothetical protein